MKKYQLNLIILLLLPLGAMADNVLFKMTTINNNALQLPDTIDEVPITTKSMSNNTFIIGGTAEVYSGRSAAGKDNHMANSKVRLIRKEDYIHIALNRPIKEGDIISLENDNEGNVHDFYVTKTTTRNSGNEITAGESPVSLTVSSGHTFIGATDLYFWWGGNSAGKDSEGKSMSNYRYVKMLTITTSDPEVKYYDFEGAVISSEANSTTVLSNGLTVYNDATPNGALETVTGITTWKNPGDALNRSVSFSVTDPCTIEIYAKGRGNTQSLYLREIDTDFAHATKDTVASSISSDAFGKYTYSYNGVADSKTIHISTSGYANIAAIRVIYNKIRPAADLTASATDIYMRVGDRKSLQLTTSSNVAVTRTRPDSGTGNIGNLNVDDATHTYTFTATALGDYVMRLSQAASEDYRAASVDVNIHIQESVERDVAIATNAGSITYDDPNTPANGGKIWTSNDGNITMIGGDESTYLIRPTDKIANGFTLNKGKSYTISVPTNKTIKKVTFYAYTNTYGDKDEAKNAQIQVNGVNSANLNYIRNMENDASTANAPNEIVYNEVDAKSFTFTINSAGVAAKIDLVIEEGSKYPVTIASGWATFYNHDDFVQMPEGMTAYYATSCNGSEILLSEVEGQVIRPDRAVVLFGTDGAGELQVISNPGQDHFYSFTSALIGTAKRTALPSGTIYCLNGEQGAFQQYTGAYIPANKAYYKYTAPAGAPAHIPFRIVQQDNTTTGIENTEFVPIDYSAPIYNLQGQQVQVTESGIYMQNGRKYLIMK